MASISRISVDTGREKSTEIGVPFRSSPLTTASPTNMATIGNLNLDESYPIVFKCLWILVIRKITMLIALKRKMINKSILNFEAQFIM